MWAFVSDYARFKILYENGGLYFDTDVELIKPIDDINIIEKGPFMSMEVSDGVPMIASGLGVVANSGMDLYRDVLESYHDSRFERLPDGIFETVVIRLTNILARYASIATE